MAPFEMTQSFITGTGSHESDLGSDEMRQIVEDALSNVPSGSRVLAIIPDKTRDDNTHILFPQAAQAAN